MNILLSVLMDAFFIALLIYCSYTDLKRREISNLLIVLLLSLGIIHAVFIGLSGNPWWTYLVSTLFAIPFFISWMRSKIGAGDVKLIMVIALYLGLWWIIIAFALMIPTIVGIIIWSLLKKKTLKVRVPFAPVLAVGAIGAVVVNYISLIGLSQ